MKRFALPLFLLFFCFSSFAWCEPSSQRPEIWLEYADALQAAGQPEKALKELANLKAAHPRLLQSNTFRWNWSLGRAHHSLGHTREAGRAFQKAAGLLPHLDEKVEVAFNFSAEYANFLRSAGEYDLAEARYVDLLRKRPGDRTLLLEKARNYAWQGRYDDATQAYDDLPDDFQAQLEKARTLFWAQRYEESFYAYGKSTHEGMRKEGCAKLALYYRRPITAYCRLNDTLKSWPDNLEALFDRAQLHYDLGAFCKSVADYQTILAKEPNHGVAKMLREHLLCRTRGSAKGFAEFRREKGRGELKDVRWWRAGLKMGDFCHPKGIYVTGESFRTQYFPGGGSDMGAFHAAAHGLKWWGPGKATEMRLQVNDYERRLPVTVNGFIRHSTPVSQCGHLEFSFERQDILDNQYNFQKKMDFNRLCFEAFWQETRAVQLFSRYGYGFFSDGNRRQEVFLSAAYEVCPSPEFLQASLNFNWLDAAHSSEFEPNRVKHPYWTPQEYWEAYFLLHWRRHACYPLYAGYERLFFDAKGRFGRDDHSHWSCVGELELFWMVNSHWEISGKAYAYRSSPYEDTHFSTSTRIWW